MLQYTRLARHPAVFRAMTGLTVAEFDELARAAVPALAAVNQDRRRRPGRRRAIGAGHPTALAPREQVLLTVVWLRRYPTDVVLGYLYGVDEATVRARGRVVPVLEALGRATMRLPDPGKYRRPTLDVLLADTPALAVVIDTYEQPIQRPKDPARADTFSSGKKKRHTRKTQVAVAEDDGRFVERGAGGARPDRRHHAAARLAVAGAPAGGLRRAGRFGLRRDRGAPPAGAGRHPPPQAAGSGPSPGGRRLQPRVRPAAGARRAQHSRLRLYDCLTHVDRHHQRLADARAVACAGLVNRHLAAHLPTPTDAGTAPPMVVAVTATIVA